MPRPDDRYLKLRTKTLEDGRVVYKSAIPIPVAVNETSDPVVYADETDRMDIIARNAYGSPQDWWRVACANSVVNGSLKLTPGKKLFIPKK